VCCLNLRAHDSSFDYSFISFNYTAECIQSKFFNGIEDTNMGTFLMRIRTTTAATSTKSTNPNILRTTANIIVVVLPPFVDPKHLSVVDVLKEIE